MSSETTADRYDTMSIKNLRQLLTLRGYDCSQCVEKYELTEIARQLDQTNFDEEAHKLFRTLNLDPVGRKSRYSNLDAIWKDPRSGATVYVGNYHAAMDRRTLQERNIVAIVNCQEERSKNYFEDDESLSYYRFFVSRLSFEVTREQAASAWKAGFGDVFAFIQGHLDQGHSVLVHCLAGAHRAGCTGTAWLMYKTGHTVDESLKMAKACRPVISPFGTLLECLHILQPELEAMKNEGK